MDDPGDASFFSYEILYAKFLCAALRAQFSLYACKRPQPAITSIIMSSLSQGTRNLVARIPAPTNAQACSLTRWVTYLDTVEGAGEST